MPGPAGVRALPGGALLVVPAVPARGLLVFFHGAGGRPDSSLPLVQPAVEQAGVLTLLPGSADRTWDVVLGRPGPDVAALDAVLATVLAEHPVQRVAFGGFSDGASYALSLGLANGDLVEALLAFSPGFAAPPGQQGCPRVWVAHGTRDRVLPVDACGRRVVRLLASAGYEVRYDEFDGEHVVRPQDVPTALDWWLGPPG